MKLSSLKNKKFQEGTYKLEKRTKKPSENFFYISGNGTF